MKCPHCDKELKTAARVSIRGMYDCHLFHRVLGGTVDDLIGNWLQHNTAPHLAEFYGGPGFDVGPSDLCPAIVLDVEGKELRRVGQMVHIDYKTKLPDPVKLEEYRKTLLADPDISRLLAVTDNVELSGLRAVCEAPLERRVVRQGPEVGADGTASE